MIPTLKHTLAINNFSHNDNYEWNIPVTKPTEISVKQQWLYVELWFLTIRPRFSMGRSYPIGPLCPMTLANPSYFYIVGSMLTQL